MASSSLALIGALVAGAVLACVFFGGLWLTIRHTVSSAALGVWLVAGFALRTALVLVGFCVVFGGHWQRLAACLIGFVLARFLIVRLLLVPQGSVSSELPNAP
jgi:F1F0 ATPase subunit 2